MYYINIYSYLINTTLWYFMMNLLHFFFKFAFVQENEIMEELKPT